VRPWLTSGRLLPGLTVRRLLTATPAALPLNKTTSAETADNAGTPQLKRYHMENTKNKEELIEELEGILKANKDNMYCDEYQLADMIREALKLHEL